MMDAILDAVQDALEDALEAVAQEAKALAPVQTGALQNSIHSLVWRDGDSVCGSVEACVPYAARVELGAPGRPATPFLYPAWQTHKAAVMGAIAAAINEGR